MFVFSRAVCFERVTQGGMDCFISVPFGVEKRKESVKREREKRDVFFFKRSRSRGAKSKEPLSSFRALSLFLSPYNQNQRSPNRVLKRTSVALSNRSPLLLPAAAERGPRERRQRRQDLGRLSRERKEPALSHALTPAIRKRERERQGATPPC